MSDAPYWVKRSQQLTDPAMRLAAAKAATRLIDSDRIRVGTHELDFWVPYKWSKSLNEVVVLLSIRISKDEVEAEFPERPDGGGPEQRLTERRRRHDRRYGGRDRDGPDVRSVIERRGPDRRIIGDGDWPVEEVFKRWNRERD